MKLYFSATALAAVMVVCLLFVSRPSAQTSVPSTDVHTFTPPARKVVGDPAALPTPRMSDGHPNLTGYWPGGAPAASDANPTAAPTAAAAPAAATAAAPARNNNPTVHELTRTADGSLFFSYAGAQGGNGELGVNTYDKITPPYKPEYLAKVQKIVDAEYGFVNPLDPNLDCKPAGVPHASFGGFVVSSPQAVAVLYEASPGPYYRIVYTDGRPHPTDIDTSYMGNSIGHWDGDSLVVDTVALDDTTWLMSPGASLHSDKEHVVERWTRKGNQVTIETTVEDPVMFTKPWVMPVRRTTLMTDDPSIYGNYILPAMCNTNDKAHLVTTDKFVCNWCNPATLYGENSDKTSQKAAAAEADKSK
jgi:hypothetical protein